MIFSISSSPSLITSFTTARFPTSAHLVVASTSRISSSVAAVARLRRSPCPYIVFCASKVRGMEEMVDEKKGGAAAAATVASSSSDRHEISSSRIFLDARSEQDLLIGIQKETEAGRLPIHIAQGMEELYQNYRNAVFQSGQPQAEEIVLSNMAIALDRILLDVRDPFEFSPHHEAIREPFDYFMFGQNYIRPLIDFRNSYVGNISIFNEMEKKLQQGENIILISNHQSEADPAVIALLLESTCPHIAENLIYVAGDRVVTDPLCKPFSMGRNLLCVYSKKHMNDDPELVDMKKRANTKSLKEMALLLRGGSKIIWIAPSGGRDRPDPVTKEWHPAPFDASSVDNMRRLTEHAGNPGNIYPLAMLCYDIMPPPAQVEKEIGEKRLISFHGTGLSVAPNISYHEIAAAMEDPEEAKVAYTQSLYSSVNEQYNVLKSAIHGKQGLMASTPIVSLSQPWQ
ncbi:glycerol-3-phosphate acyltransferase, chloroplastic isoform X1 [Olea europaea var. sylvestris]|uniref:glycerol-3-phosphate acyltransferase, chloroplastic isoform X1 n=1 Tax=Olea europaea var. sylvestris TaxID=158386 RepID=UPI000C1CD1EA|nr:glycerol-3-phosphate acyltransferase, chloroplastic isoform X1 [Olea europaea var. sylvestris]